MMVAADAQLRTLIKQATVRPAHHLLVRVHVVCALRREREQLTHALRQPLGLAATEHRLVVEDGAFVCELDAPELGRVASHLVAKHVCVAPAVVQTEGVRVQPLVKRHRGRGVAVPHHWARVAQHEVAIVGGDGRLLNLGVDEHPEVTARATVPESRSAS